MTEAREEVRAFLRALSVFIATINGGPEINSYMISTLVVLRNALRRHEDALRDLVPLENGETDASKRRPLSRYLTRGLHTSARIFYSIRHWCGDDRYPAGVLEHRSEVAVLSDHIIRETYEQQRVIFDYRIANNSLW